MKRVILALVLGWMLVGCSNQADETTVKSILVTQLENSHTNQDWYVPVKVATEGLSYAQASWKDSTDNHSILEIVSHLIFWNERVLRTFQGEEVPDFDNNNDATFRSGDELDWMNRVEKLDSVHAAWVQVIQSSPDAKLGEWSSEISNMAAHTAYHTGQIIYIRKRNGWWK